MKIEVYSKTTCPFCVRAKEFLKENEISYTEFVFDDDQQRQEMYDFMGLVGNQRTVPQIVLVEDDGTRSRIGGYTELLKSDVVARHRVAFDTDF